MQRKKFITRLGIAIFFILSIILLNFKLAYAVEYTYDENNRIIKITYDDRSYETFIYDKNGNIIESKMYDCYGKIIKEDETMTSVESDSKKTSSK